MGHVGGAEVVGTVCDSRGIPGGLVCGTSLPRSGAAKSGAPKSWRMGRVGGHPSPRPELPPTVSRWGHTSVLPWEAAVLNCAPGLFHPQALQNESFWLAVGVLSFTPRT